MNMSNLELLLYQAKFSEKAERFDDMADLMKTLTLTATSELTPEERNMFSVAYKNVVGARRTSWRVILNIEQHESNTNGVTLTLKLARDYRTLIEEEIKVICNDVLVRTRVMTAK